MANEHSETEAPVAPASDVRAPQEFKLPFAITLAALAIYFGFQTLQLVAQRSELGAVKNSQEGALQAAQKVQDQFKALTTKLDELAKQGHAGAKTVLDSFQGTGSALGPKAGQ